MKHTKTTKRFCFLLVAGLLGSGLTPAYGQDENQADQNVFELSPFEVQTSGDKGYYASNTISGSRISVPIQDIPLTIEVVTSEFIEDTGATDLRDSLKYSAGLLIESQNDAFGKFDNLGGVNNTEGATGDKGDSSFKIRGFVLENTLRNGFRRKHSTDSINVDRIEVVRGPSALLYGVGNFGGIVNYITKTPLPEFQQKVEVGFGSENYRRATIDSTGPILDNLGYRLNYAYQDKDDWTELNTTEKWFIAPVLQWKPFKKVKLTVDYEYGWQDEDAISFKSVRAPVKNIPLSQADRLETFGFVEFDNEDVRTFRWSGPDTYLNTESWNASAALDIQILENLSYRGGINVSKVEFDWRQVNGGIIQEPAPNSLAAQFADTIIARQIIDGKTNDVEEPVENAVLQYSWGEGFEESDWLQHRHELNLNFRTFDGNRWFASDHNFLAGYSFESEENMDGNYVQDGLLYQNPTDSSYLRWQQPAIAPDGTEQEFGELNPQFINRSTAQNEGIYLVYSGRFLQDRLFLVAGYRKDTTSSLDGSVEAVGSRNPFGPPSGAIYPDSEISQDSTQYGASFQILKGLTVFALQSEGVEPNFGGIRDGSGKALEATIAEAQEFGIKFNLLDGKIAGTLSKFKIERSGFPWQYWWAPSPVRGSYRRNDDIIYRFTGEDGWPLQETANKKWDFIEPNIALYQAAVAAGAIFEAEIVESPVVGNEEPTGKTGTYINASKPEGAAFLDAVFATLNEQFAESGGAGDPWAGWLYNGARHSTNDVLVNTAAEDRTDGDYWQEISDQSEGYELQLILSPTENWQIILNYSHVEREVLNPGNLLRYPFADDLAAADPNATGPTEGGTGRWDRWSTWYYPNIAWGLAGFQPEEIYPGGPEGQPNRDTSTWTGIGWGKGESLDDTPADTISVWSNYKFTSDSPLDGLEVGLGGLWESEREYASANTSAGQRKLTDTGSEIKAFTDTRLTINGMVRYNFGIGESADGFVQVNVDNMFDDDDQYGYNYAPGRSWKILFGLAF